MKNILTTLFVFLTLTGFASAPTSHRVEIKWENGAVPIRKADGTVKYYVYRFRDALYDPAYPELPYYFHQFPAEGSGSYQVRIIEAEYESLETEGRQLAEVVGSELQFNTYTALDRDQWVGGLRFIPIRETGGGYEKLITATLELTFRPAPAPLTLRGGDYADESVLASGDIYRLQVTATGMHRLDYDFLINEVGLSPSVDPRRLHIYGNGGGMLPESVDEERSDDLVQNAIQFVGESDGSLDPGDYLLFYGQGPHVWKYNAEVDIFDYQLHEYDRENYYFLKVGAENGLRIASRASTGGSYTSTIYNDYHCREDELVNLLNDDPSGQGSGREWYGDQFKIQRSYTYSDGFSFPGVRTDEEAHLKVRVLGRSPITGTKAEATVAGQTFTGANFLSTDLSDSDDPYASIRQIESNFFPTGSNLSVTVAYPQTAVETQGWVDFVQVNVRRNLSMSGDQMHFRDLKSLDHPSTTFQISNAGGDLRIWDVSNPLVPVQQQFNQNGATASFGVETNQLREFIAFRPNGDFLVPQAVSKLGNQNLHGIDDVDFVILYHPDLRDQAQRLADHRADNSDLNIRLVSIFQVYNEFSSGKLDPTAIRDFATMLFSRDPDFRYLLLFGDGSFDPRNLTGLGNNLIPTYQTQNSVDPISAFPSDDYYGLLTNDSGMNMLDIAVGRLPVRNPEEANTVVDKIIRYETSPAGLGDWRNRMVFVGDDEDGGIHTRDVDEISEEIKEQHPGFNFDKVYVDAFNQVSTPGGQRVPSATEALNQNIFKGTLAITYLGHGGPKGWAQERILQIPDINSWNNTDQLPLFITATCTFAGYDDPSFTSAGERTLLNEDGGAIALYSTVRPVLSTQNAFLTERVTDTLFARVNGQAQTIGEVMRIAKNMAGGGNNSRKFTLLGDPTMSLALPRYQVTTTSINGVDVTQMQPDTIRALEKVTVEGEIRDENGQLLESFNGILYPTIFDKAISLETLGQDGTPVRDYEVQKSILFKGRASVVNGKFSFTFVVPKDINYEFGYGKLSYYAEDGSQQDAGGHYSNLTIGGTNPDGLADDEGPQVEVFMDSEDFVFGGLTSENPILLVLLEDDNGINVVGTSIGHDLTGILDENTQNTYLLNDFYQAALDDYTRGEVRYPLSELAEGRHAIEVRAFDVVNNSATGYTEFVVANSGKVALEHVLNYPNPFVDNTCFQFEHNMAGQSLDVMIQIYTVSGRLVKTIQERISTTDNRLSLGDCIRWDGRDDYGDVLARGVYIYKVRVRAADTGDVLLEGESEFEKLVILK